MKSSPNHLCGQTEVVLCALQIHSLETSCFPHWGLALVSHRLTSTSFGWSWWPVAGLQLHIWPPLPLQSAVVGSKPCLCTVDRLHWIQGKRCPVTKNDTGANGANTAAVIYPESLDCLYHLFKCSDMIFFSTRAVKWDLVTPSFFCVVPQPSLNRGNLSPCLVFFFGYMAQ